MIRVLVADDHCIVREGLKLLTSLVDDVVVTSEANSGDQVLEILNKHDTDVIVLDVSMPGISGVDLVSAIKQEHAKTPILVLTMHNESQMAKRLLTAGVSGYLTKDNEPEIILSAIRKVAQGERFIDPVLADLMVFGNCDEGGRSAQKALSHREFEILCLLGKGNSLGQIADTLSISSKTVSTHKTRIMRKMGWENNADLLRYAIEHGLTE